MKFKNLKQHTHW